MYAPGSEVVRSHLLYSVRTKGKRGVPDGVGEGRPFGIPPLETLRVVGVGHRLGEDGAVGGDDQPPLLARLAERGSGVARVIAVGLGCDGLYPCDGEQQRAEPGEHHQRHATCGSVHPSRSSCDSRASSVTSSRLETNEEPP